MRRCAAIGFFKDSLLVKFRPITRKNKVEFMDMQQRAHHNQPLSPPRQTGETAVRATLTSFRHDNRGGIALMFALMLPVMIGFVALGIDVGIWFKDRRQLQTMADAAAVSAAIENTYGATTAEILAAAQMEADSNGFDATTDTLDYASTPTSGSYSGDSAYIEVRITRQLETILSQVYITLDPSTTARAVASTISDQEACVLALSSTAMNAVYLNGAGTTVSMVGCSVVANSTHSTKAINAQNGTLTTECLWAVGGISGEANMNTACSSTTSGATAVSDPFSALTVPTYDPSGCLTGNGNNAYSPADGDALSPGVFCDGLSISAGDTVTMAAGTYIIDEGDFTVNGNASITGTDVTIILTSTSGSSYGSIKITGGGTVDLAAPTDAADPFRGILFFQDPDAPSSASLDSIVTGGSEVELGGAIYLPNNDISFSGGNTADSNGCLMLVAQTVSFNGSADIDNECDMYGGNAVTYGTKPGLVE